MPEISESHCCPHVHKMYRLALVLNAVPTNQSLGIRLVAFSHLLFFSTETFTDITVTVDSTCSLPFSYEFSDPSFTIPCQQQRTP